MNKQQETIRTTAKTTTTTTTTTTAKERQTITGIKTASMKG